MGKLYNQSMYNNIYKRYGKYYVWIYGVKVLLAKFKG